MIENRERAKQNTRKIKRENKRAENLYPYKKTTKKRANRTEKETEKEKQEKRKKGENQENKTKNMNEKRKKK